MPGVNPEALRFVNEGRGSDEGPRTKATTGEPSVVLPGENQVAGRILLGLLVRALVVAPV